MSFASGPPGPSFHASLTALGYGDRWAALLAEAPPGAEPGRVVRDDRGSVIVAGDGWQQRLNLPRDLSAVTGDWVAVHDGAVVGVLDRATEITRRRGDEPQTLAANVDLVGLVHGLDQPLNRRRLERGLVIAWESGALPLVLLTKADVAADFAAAVTDAAGSAPGVDVVPLSVVDGRGLDDLRALLQPDRTLALLGASGAGKSSLANALLGTESLPTGEVRTGDRRGRHTTTHRELVVVPGGGLLLDTPGLRALTLGGVEHGVDLAFPEIQELADRCRFADCTHQHEPGCAVLAAVAGGDLAEDRYEGWRRVQREVANAELRADQAAYRKAGRAWGRMAREAMARKRRDD